MIGSRGGWREVPYAACPADPGSLAAGVCVIESSLGPLHLVPGVIQNGTEPNVMRGEETQILGALASDRALAREALLVLPGTHCKWVVVQAGLIQRFATHMTGELFALLRDHSLLGRPAQDAPHHTSDADEAAHAAFLRGIRTARDAGPEGLSGRLFTTRSLFLTGELAAPHTLDYLSGLLIGEEIRSALAAPGVPSKGPVLLVGNPALCARYHLSLGEFGIHHAQSLEDTAPCGLWKIAEAYGLVPRLAQP
jgi:2-dehydro-3-deoxygalactonokinase